MSLACPNCGSAPDPRDLFCETCGHPVRVHAPQTAETLATPAYGRAQWPGWTTSRTSQAAAAGEADQRTSSQRPVRDLGQVSQDVPEPRGTGDGGWDDWTARAKTTPRPAPTSAASESSRPASASVRPAEAFAAAVSGSTRLRVANPRDQAESVAASADPQSYITSDDRRMGYADLGVSGSLDPLSNSRFFWQLARRFALYFVVSGVISFALWVLAFIVTLSTGGLAAVGNGGGAFSAVAIIDLLITAALMAMFLFMPVPALLGQWSRMLTFQAPAAASALDHVQRALDRHATPHDNIGLRALCPPGEGRRNYLELRRGYFAGYVSCFPHGRDLYVGWTFWIYISPVRLFLIRIGRRFQDYTGRGNDMYQTLRYEAARATIAALHTCTLEGVDIATGGTPVPDGSDGRRRASARTATGPGPAPHGSAPAAASGGRRSAES